jgi:LSD1 subclass zinc finger protein
MEARVTGTKKELIEVHCKKCGKLLVKINGAYQIKCSRCKTMNEGEVKPG